MIWWAVMIVRAPIAVRSPISMYSGCSLSNSTPSPTKTPLPIRTPEARYIDERGPSKGMKLAARWSRMRAKDRITCAAYGRSYRPGHRGRVENRFSRRAGSPHQPQLPRQHDEHRRRGDCKRKERRRRRHEWTQLAETPRSRQQRRQRVADRVRQDEDPGRQRPQECAILIKAPQRDHESHEQQGEHVRLPRSDVCRKALAAWETGAERADLTHPEAQPIHVRRGPGHDSPDRRREAAADHRAHQRAPAPHEHPPQEREKLRLREEG